MSSPLYKIMQKRWDFYKVRFSSEAIEELKKRRIQKDKILNYHHFEYENRWVGDVGEYTFKKWLSQIPILYRASKHYTNKTEIDLMDFSVDNTHFIDVKTTYCKYKRPSIFDNCIVTENQVESNRVNQKINCYVFCRYYEPEMSCYIMGFIFWYDFLSVAKKWNKNDVIRNNINFVASSNCYDVMTTQLKNINELFLSCP